MIVANKLIKKFDEIVAVDGLSLNINDQEIFGLLGPNGAGKTTTIRMFTGILKPSSGNVTIGGHDIQKKPLAARQIIGVVPEMANAYIDLSAYRNMLLMGELYGMAKDIRKERANELLRRFKLYDRRKLKVKKFSKGMKQRLIVAMSLISKPKLLFLDEPTSGLDVASVRLIREVIIELNKKGTTVLLTTHNIEEANQLCDRVAIMNRGRIVVIDRPENLKRMMGINYSIEVAFQKPFRSEKNYFSNVTSIKKAGDRFRLYTDNPSLVIFELCNYSKQTGNQILSLVTLEPSLEDVFVNVTGRKNK